MSFGSGRLAGAVLLLLALVAPITDATACGRESECGDLSAWTEFSRIALKYNSPQRPGTYEWRFLIDPATSDLLIDTETREITPPRNGTIGVVGGRVMLSKGTAVEAGYEIDALDAPALTLQQLLMVLGRVFPKGPAELTGAVELDRSYDTGIRFATPSASGELPGPWQVRGKVEKSPAGEVKFDLTMTTSAANKHEMHFVGELGRHDQPLFRDSDPLDGWAVYEIGPRVIKKPGGTIYDYGATPREGSPYKSIGEIRADLAAEDSPGSADPSKDFTGFWKKSCDLPYGLQIMHRGEEGKYSVVFCGPGGCGDPDEGRLTYITGDRSWEVVSEDELINLGRSGDRDSYRRCTRETHPVLKYEER